MPDRDAERDDRSPHDRTKQHAMDDPARLALRREFRLEELDKSSFAPCAHNAGIFVEAAHGRILPKNCDQDRKWQQGDAKPTTATVAAAEEIPTSKIASAAFHRSGRAVSAYQTRMLLTFFAAMPPVVTKISGRPDYRDICACRIHDVEQRICALTLCLYWY